MYTHSFNTFNASPTSEYCFTKGSHTIHSASNIAAIVSLFISKGKPPTQSDLLRNTLIAVFKSTPNSPYMASHYFKISLSKQILKLVVLSIILAPLHINFN